jgi:hypothetical protein
MRGAAGVVVASGDEVAELTGESKRAAAERLRSLQRRGWIEQHARFTKAGHKAPSGWTTDGLRAVADRIAGNRAAGGDPLAGVALLVELPVAASE